MSTETPKELTITFEPDVTSQEATTLLFEMLESMITGADLSASGACPKGIRPFLEAALTAQFRAPAATLAAAFPVAASPENYTQFMGKVAEAVGTYLLAFSKAADEPHRNLLEATSEARRAFLEHYLKCFAVHATVSLATTNPGTKLEFIIKAPDDRRVH